MNLKTIILVIIISIVSGAAIFWFTMKPKTATNISTQPQEVPLTATPLVSPSPLPSQSPIDKNTDLSAEIKNQTSPDFSEDYKKLKEEVNSSF